MLEGIDGALLTPGSPEYDAARRPENRAYADVRPALVLRCCSEADVVQGLTFARETGLPVVPRGGGHCFAGTVVHRGAAPRPLRPERRRDRRDPGHDRCRRPARRGVRRAAPARPHPAGRLRGDRGHRRTHPGRWHRAARPPLRADLRPPGRGPGRARRRSGRRLRAGRRARPFLGAAGRGRRPVRGGHVADLRLRRRTARPPGSSCAGHRPPRPRSSRPGRTGRQPHPTS